MKPQNDIQAELKSLNSQLGEMPKTMPYHVPPTYFEQLTSRATTHASAQAAEASYIVPEGYFDNMPNTLLERIKAEENKTQKSRTINIDWRRISLVAAASLLLLVSIGIYLSPNEQTQTTAENLALVPDDAILAYVEDNIDEFDIDLIKSSISTNTTIEPTFNQIDNNTINEYLNTPDWE